MCMWCDRIIPYASGYLRIPAIVIRDACYIIKEAAENRRYICYSELMEKLKAMGHRKINRGTIGWIVGEVSNKIAINTNPSIYPSAIVVRKGTQSPGSGFWTLKVGTDPPSKVSSSRRRYALLRYQHAVFMSNWKCCSEDKNRKSKDYDVGVIIYGK